MRRTLYGYAPDRLGEALRLFIRAVEQEFGWKLIGYEFRNLNRHVLLRFRDLVLGERQVYLIFQREPFHKFKEFFRHPYEAYTINCDLLEEVSKTCDFIFWVSGNGDIYYINARLALRIVKEYKWYREQYGGELACHIPVDKLRKMGKKTTGF